MSWFSRSRKNDTEPDDVPTGPPLPEPVVALLTDVGKVRTSNEDSGLILRANSGKEATRGVLVVVADGMGGHEAGEVASQTAVGRIAEVYAQAPGTPGQAIEAAFNEAHKSIRAKSASEPAFEGMGTTCTALVIVGNGAWSSHVGDSRLYIVRGGEIYQLSEDQTVCMEMVRKGLLTMEEARNSEERNVLQHAMGTRPELVTVSFPKAMQVRRGDSFLLCSDGLHDLVTDSEMCAVVRGAPPEEACRRLIAMACDRGGPDNITVAIVSIPAEDLPQEPLKETRVSEVLKS